MHNLRWTLLTLALGLAPVASSLAATPPDSLKLQYLFTRDSSIVCETEKRLILGEEQTLCENSVAGKKYILRGKLAKDPTGAIRFEGKVEEVSFDGQIKVLSQPTLMSTLNESAEVSQYNQNGQGLQIKLKASE